MRWTKSKNGSVGGGSAAVSKPASGDSGSGGVEDPSAAVKVIGNTTGGGLRSMGEAIVRVVILVLYLPLLLPIFNFLPWDIMVSVESPIGQQV